MIDFGLNHIAAPGLGCEAFFDLARRVGIDKVEMRNDIPGAPLADATPAAAVAELAAAHGVSVLTVNALQRFNDWSGERAAQASALSRAAREAGAQALVLVPVNDAAFRPADAERLAGLREALAALAPILAEAGLLGFVEPLGFDICSLRLKREALEAIDAVGGADRFRLVHDTFHHHLAGEAEMFPERTGLVHISGVEETALAIPEMRDPHRVLVRDGDRVGNIAQMRALLAGGYAGTFSFEPFAQSVQRSEHLPAELAASISYIESEIGGPSA
jgi:2-keto-myo-inositol isomerase